MNLRVRMVTGASAAYRKRKELEIDTSKVDGQIFTILNGNLRGSPWYVRISFEFPPWNIQPILVMEISDYSDAEDPQQLVMPAEPIKGNKKQRKAGGLGKKGKVFATKDKMLELVNRINSEQEHKIGLLMERDVRKSV